MTHLAQARTQHDNSVGCEMSSKHSGHTSLLRQDKFSSASGGGASDDLWSVKLRVRMCLTRVLGQTPFLMGGLWHFSTFAVFIKVLTDLIMCVWVGGCVLSFQFPHGLVQT